MNQNRSVRLGACAWLLATLQFFVVMLVVQLGWKTPYSWATNNISDLGNIHCGDFEGRYICSPRHGLMNFSFVLGGLLFVAGVLLTNAAWPRTAGSYLIRLLLIATAGGWVVAGSYPADVNEDAHVVFGAFVIFVFGNLALLLCGFLRTGPVSSTRWYAVALGGLGLAAMVLHFGHHGLGLGVGGMERVTAFGVPVWLALTGTLLLRRHALVPPAANRLGVRP